MNRLSQARLRRVLDKLAEAYPDARCALHFRNPFELLIATILSAQCTDARVNQVTARLFQKYQSPADYAALTPDILQVDIQELGLFRSKAEHIIAASRMLLERFGGEVPRTREELLQLPGVGRKTANVVLANAFGIRGETVTARKDVVPTIESARKSEQTVLIDFRVEQEDSVYPMVPAGAALHDMIRRPNNPLVETALEP
ncbi:MAG: endonuclease III [Alicyclobacillus sp.]|nr:endonuclease III [Alicyclobacillus sp.]